MKGTLAFLVVQTIIFDITEFFPVNLVGRREKSSEAQILYYNRALGRIIKLNRDVQFGRLVRTLRNTVYLNGLARLKIYMSSLVNKSYSVGIIENNLDMTSGIVPLFAALSDRNEGVLLISERYSDIEKYIFFRRKLFCPDRVRLLISSSIYLRSLFL